MSLRVVIAPDSLKGSLDAAKTAEAIAHGIADARPDVESIQCPLADGGEGTLDILLRAMGGTMRPVEATDPLGRRITVPVGLTDEGTTAIVELAQVSGYSLIAANERNPLVTSTFGLGLVVRAAVESGVDRVILGLGGSATVDGGAGMMQALGIRLLDDHGLPMDDGVGGGRLADIRGLTWQNPPDGLESIHLSIACDVLNPACGENGAAAVFGPQKGADAAAVAKLERGMQNWLSLLERTSGIRLRDELGGGAAGGVAMPLLAFCHAEIIPGVDLVFEAVRLAEKIADADLVITSEGKLDRQSLMGKVVGAVARSCRAADVPCVAIVGACDESFDAMGTLLDRVYTLECAPEETARRLRECAAIAVRECL